jgi:hypothetical protein
MAARTVRKRLIGLSVETDNVPTPATEKACPRNGCGGLGPGAYVVPGLASDAAGRALCARFCNGRRAAAGPGVHDERAR